MTPRKLTTPNVTPRATIVAVRLCMQVKPPPPSAASIVGRPRCLTSTGRPKSWRVSRVPSVEPDAADERQLQRQIARIQAERQAQNVHLEPFLGGREQPEYAEEAR